MRKELQERRDHFKAIAKWWWAMVIGAWGLFWTADSVIQKWAPPDYKALWISYTEHVPLFKPGTWLIVLLIIFIIFLFEGSYRHLRHTKLAFENELASAKQAAAKRETELRAAAELSSTPDPWLSLLQHRQKLEADLQPLLKIEECAVRVIPALKVGKDEDDYRQERIQRLKRDIEAINSQLALRHQNEDATQVDLMNEWKELAVQFREVSLNIRVEWQRGGLGFDEGGEPIEEFWFAGGDFNKCLSLCKRAGVMLLRSPKVSSKLSDRIKKEPLPEDRWLKFLTGKEGAVSNRTHSLPHDDGTGRTVVIYAASLANIGQTSEHACIDCSTDEL